MKFLILLFLLAGCSDAKLLEGKCLKPFIYSGRVIKVKECTNKPWYSDTSDYCIIEKGNYIDIVFSKYLVNSIEVACPEY